MTVQLDTVQAEKFLSALTGQEDPAVSFQTFDDTQEKRKNLIHVMHGKFSKFLGLLADLNDQGAGMFVTVNETDLKGREESNVVGLRALFVDHDFKGGKLLQDVALPPSIVVASGNGRHYYWLLQPGESVERFRNAQTQLITFYGSDPKVKDPPRVMRLPGFYHRKAEPILTVLEECHAERRYTIDEILACHPVAEPLIAAPTSSFVKPATVGPKDERMQRCAAYMDKRDPAIQGSGGDAWTLETAMIGGDFDLSEGEFWPILCNWNARCSPPWDEKDLSDKLRNAEKYRKGPRGQRLSERDWKPARPPKAKPPKQEAPTPDAPAGSDQPPAQAPIQGGPLFAIRAMISSPVDTSAIIEEISKVDDEIQREELIVDLSRARKIGKKIARQHVGKHLSERCPDNSGIDPAFQVSIDRTRYYIGDDGVFPVKYKDGIYSIDRRIPIATRPIWPDRLGRDRALGGLSARLNWQTPGGAIVQEWMPTHAFVDRDALAALDGAPVSLGRISQLSDFLQDALGGMILERADLISRIGWLSDEFIKPRTVPND